MMSQGNSTEISKSRLSYLYKSIEKEGNHPNPSDKKNVTLITKVDLKKTLSLNLEINQTYKY